MHKEGRHLSHFQCFILFNFSKNGVSHWMRGIGKGEDAKHHLLKLLKHRSQKNVENRRFIKLSRLVVGIGGEWRKELSKLQGKKIKFHQIRVEQLVLSGLFCNPCLGLLFRSLTYLLELPCLMGILSY